MVCTHARTRKKQHKNTRKEEARNQTASHVLVPSPLYLGQFISLTKHIVREVNRTLVLCDEFGQRTARILAEEEVYTSNKAFRVCLIDTILCDDVDSASASLPDVSSGGAGSGSSNSSGGSRRGRRTLTVAMMLNQMQMPKRVTLPACTEFLFRNPVNVIVAKNVLEQPRVFIKTYTFVRGYEKFAAEKVRGFVGKAIDAFVCASPDYRRLSRMPRQALRLSLIISSFVVGNCHDKIWNGLCGESPAMNSSAACCALRPLLLLQTASTRSTASSALPAPAQKGSPHMSASSTMPSAHTSPAAVGTKRCGPSSTASGGRPLGSASANGTCAPPSVT